jgi:hypothetical protein
MRSIKSSELFNPDRNTRLNPALKNVADRLSDQLEDHIVECVKANRPDLLPKNDPKK